MKENCNFYAKARQILAENGVSSFVCEEDIETFLKLTDIMTDVGKKMNLTAIKDFEGIFAKHYADSLLVADKEIIPPGASVADVGCGAGFPSFPLAIARKDISVVGIDSTQKKVNYINETASALGISNLSARQGRAEEECANDGKYRGKYDVVCARAVAPLPILCEICLPYVKVGGAFVAMKAKNAENELSLSMGAIKALGAELRTCIKKEIVCLGEKEERNIIIIDKITKTPPNFPRQYSKIHSKPL